MNKKHSNTTSLIRDAKRRTRRKFSAAEKIRIVIEGLPDKVYKYLHDT